MHHLGLNTFFIVISLFLSIIQLKQTLDMIIELLLFKNNDTGHPETKFNFAIGHK